MANVDKQADYLRVPENFTSDLLGVILSVRSWSEVRAFVSVMPLEFQLRNHWRIVQAECLHGQWFVRLVSTDHRLSFWCSWLLVIACFEQAE